MSVVTGIMLMLGAADWDSPPFEEVQRWLASKGRPQLKDVSEFSAGGKHPQFEAWAAGFNYFELEQEFAAFVLSRDWRNPDNVILIMNPEEGPMGIYRPTVNEPETGKLSPNLENSEGRILKSG